MKQGTKYNIKPIIGWSFVARQKVSTPDFRNLDSVVEEEREVISVLVSHVTCCVTVRHMCNGPYSAHPSRHMSHPLIGCDRCDGATVGWQCPSFQLHGGVLKPV